MEPPKPPPYHHINTSDDGRLFERFVEAAVLKEGYGFTVMQTIVFLDARNPIEATDWIHHLMTGFVDATKTRIEGVLNTPPQLPSDKK